LWFVGAAPDGLDGAPMEDIAALFRQQEEAKRTKEHTADTAYAKNIKDNQSDQLTSLYETFLGKNDIEQIKQAKEQTELVRKLSPNAEVLEEVQNINNQIFTQQRLFFNEVNQQEQKNTIGEKIRSLRAQKLVLLTKEIQRLQTADLDRHTLAPLGMKVNTRLVDAEFSFKPGVTLNMKKLRKKHRVNNIVSSLNFVNQSNRGNAKKMSEE
jgi:RecA/RadA recombinase